MTFRAPFVPRIASLLTMFVFLSVCYWPAIAHSNHDGRVAPALKDEAAKSEEQVVGKISGGNDFKGLSAAGEHAAWIEENAASSKWTVYLDGRAIGGKYDRIQHLEFSPDGTRLAFFGLANSDWTFVVDTTSSTTVYATAYTDVSPVVFQPHGSSWAYRACYSENSCTMVAGGHVAVMPRETYDQISSPQYSADGKHLGFLAQFHGKWSAIVDGKPVGPPISSFSCSGFSPDGAHFYVCGSEKKVGHDRWAYYVDGISGPEFAQIGPIAFTPDSAHYAYGASGLQVAFKKDETTGTIVLDGKPGASFEGRGLPGAWVTLLNAPIVAAEVYSGGEFIYPAVFVPGRFVVSTKVLSADLNGVSDPVFSNSGGVVFAARRGKNDIAVFNGTDPGPRFDDVLSDVVFAEDGLHSAYIARQGDSLLAVRDNQPGAAVSLDVLMHRKSKYFDAEGNPIKPPPLDLSGFSIGWAALSSHSAHFAYEIIKGGLRFRSGRTPRADRIVVFDGKLQKSYNAADISVVQFTPDERHYWYAVIGSDGKKSMAVVDGHETKLYDDMTEAQIESEKNEVVFFAREKNRILRIAVPLVEGSAKAN